MKIVKKQIVLIAVLLFGACNPLEDELEVVEAENSIPALDIEYTLTEDDYETADEVCECARFGNFSDEDDVKIGIPAVLNDVFPALGNGSSAIVTYDFFRGFDAPEEEPWIDAADDNRYSVVAADYTSVSAAAGNAGFFNNTTRAADNISDILKANITTPTDGDLAAVTFKWSSSEYSNYTFSENYNGGDLSGVQTISVTGDEAWEWDSSSSGYNYAGMSGFGGDTGNEDWLITPQLDLTGRNAGTTTLRLRQVLAFLDAPTVVGTDIAVRISTDYNGTDPSTATWTDLTAQFDQFPTGSGADFGQYESQVSLAAWEGQQVYIGFYYRSTLDNSALWRVIDIGVDNGTPVNITTQNEFYEYSESTDFWSPADEDGYFVTEADFESMGVFLNFGSDVPADDYLPQFLTTLRPFAQEEDEQVIVYDYVSSSSGAQIRGDFYTFLGGTWVKWESTVAQTLGFAHDGTGWEADNTIKYSLTGDDYTAIAAAYASSNSAGSESMSDFGNYDIGLWSSTEIFESITTRLETNFGPIPAGQKYLVSYAVWKPGNDVFTLNVIYDGSSWSEITE